MKIKFKKLLSFILTGSLILSSVGCQSTNTAEESNKGETQVEESATRIVVDHEGVEVEIPTQIDRIVVGNTLPLASVLSVYLGGAEKIVGLHPASMSAAESGLLSEIYPEILEAKTDFINGSEINIEELLKDQKLISKKNIDSSLELYYITENQIKNKFSAGLFVRYF